MTREISAGKNIGFVLRRRHPVSGIVYHEVEILQGVYSSGYAAWAFQEGLSYWVLLFFFLAFWRGGNEA